MDSKTKFMLYALQIANKGLYKTYKNPLVGSVIVHNNKIIGEGFHQKFGGNHAEVNAINSVKDKSLLKKSTIYITLEPCSHYGKTPPCTDIIIKSGIKNVIIAQKDTNPIVKGKSLKILKQHGIKVEVGILKEKAYLLNRFYNYFHSHKKPFICVKFSSTLNGKGTFIKNTRTKITSDDSLQDLYLERKNYQAILIGIGTALIDDPILTVRDKNFLYPPIRIIIDKNFNINPSLNIIKDKSAPTWIFTCCKLSINQKKLFNYDHISIFYKEVWNPNNILEKLYELGVQSLFIEGGSNIISNFLLTECVNEFLIYLAPLIFFNKDTSIIKDCLNINNKYIYLPKMIIKQLSQDIKIKATPIYKEKKCLQE